MAFRQTGRSTTIMFVPARLLEDVCICNNGVLEVFTSRSTASSGNSSNNNATMISSKLICFNNWIDLSNIC